MTHSIFNNYTVRGRLPRRRQGVLRRPPHHIHIINVHKQFAGKIKNQQNRCTCSPFRTVCFRGWQSFLLFSFFNRQSYCSTVDAVSY